MISSYIERTVESQAECPDQRVASKQSPLMRGYFELETEVAKSALRFGLGEIPRPPFWSGFRVVPEWIEFWLQKPFRRHQRILSEWVPDAWQKRWLYP